MRRQRRTRPGGRRLRAALPAVVAALGLVAAPATLAGTRATFSATTTNTGDALATAQLQPPSGLAVTQSCTGTPTITLRTYSAAVGTTSVSIIPPTGTTTGDLLVAQISYRDGAETITAPSGWSLVTSASSGTAVTSAIYWKAAGAGEPTAVFSRPAGSPGDMAGTIVDYIGARTSTPVAVVGNATGLGTTATTPAVTTTATTTEVTYFLTKRQDILPIPTGTTQIYSGQTSGGPNGLGADATEVTFTGPGSVPQVSSTSTSANYASTEWVAQTLVLRRVAGTPTANLSWTASTSSWASGYVLDRQAPAGTSQGTRNLTAVSTTSTTDGPLTDATGYTFTLTTYRGTWRSSQVTATLTTDC